ncbi:MAG TPA: prepilin-type N-terminal cleavage/methylation domain-containing protein [Noviherbaspirillum sp.]|jgi:prepilin-type N-terminal cleavage/methylation domain-containing protein|uniref:prepilin-type N-terminal cleavage/methylation domain-containing protein n=1 Tax=Noviherbaspirillum sp. TaxID=1926288 RepID=UPI002F93750F
MQHARNKAQGFTLVEIAIVLVIIGLLLGGVLKGQEMIENSRIKAVVNDMNGVSAAYNAYFDRYRALPGDEAAATMTARGWAGTLGGDGNGVLAIAPADAFLNTGEQASMWRALRASGLATGDPTLPAAPASLPRAGNGGLLAVALGTYGMAGPSVCVSGLTHKQAAGVDVAVDGALPANNIGNNAGSVRGANNAVAPLAPAAAVAGGAAYNENAATLWTLCRRM